MSEPNLYPSVFETPEQQAKYETGNGRNRSRSRLARVDPVDSRRRAHHRRRFADCNQRSLTKMPKISHVISSLLQIQAVIGDREVVLKHVDDCDIPLPDAEGMGVDILDAPDFDVLFPRQGRRPSETAISGSVATVTAGIRASCAFHASCLLAVRSPAKSQASLLALLPGAVRLSLLALGPAAELRVRACGLCLGWRFRATE